MGVLRLLLAICVVFGHVSFNPLFTGPVAAVQSFYIISGFYIAMVLDTTVAYRSALAFYINRYLRLYPVYIVAATFATVFKVLNEHAAIARFDGLPLAAKGMLLFANSTLFFQDWLMFLGVYHGHLAVVHNIKAPVPFPLYHFLALPPSWSLGVELSFYLLAPCLVRLSNRWIGALITASLICRLVCGYIGFNADPWSYRFFPFEIGTFCLGIASYRLYALWKEKEWFNRRSITTPLLVGFFLCTIFFSEIHFIGLRPIYLLAVCVTVPPLFHVSKRVRWDRQIGELSYPVYIIHQLVLDVWLAIPCCRRMCDGGIRLSIIICGCSIGVALLLNRFVQQPLEKIRQRRKIVGNDTECLEQRLNIPAAAE